MGFYYKINNEAYKCDDTRTPETQQVYFKAIYSTSLINLCESVLIYTSMNVRLKPPQSCLKCLLISHRPTCLSVSLKLKPQSISSVLKASHRGARAPSSC